ncbi:MAG: DUF4198 domain-containing protein [Halobacteriota archaeon]
MTVSKIFRGHEIWLEPTRTHFHKGELVKVKVGWGHALRTDGPGEKEKWTPYMITPSGEKLMLPVVDSEGEYFLLLFRAEEKGSYTVVVENNYGVGTKLRDGSFHRGPKKDYDNVERTFYFYQYAKTCIPIGHSKELPERAGNELEITPLNLGSDNLELEVAHKGKPLPEAVLEGTSNRHDGFTVKTTTDKLGRAEISVDKPTWMFRVHYFDKKGLEGLYDQIRLTATYTIIMEGI